jgi:ATP-dependent DNA ligase
MKRRIDSSIVLFDVTYVDGSQTSRRKVLRSIVDSFEGEAAVRASLEAQDREIELASGRSRGAIKSVVRSRS